MNYNQNNSFVDNTLALGAQKNVKQLINAKDGKGEFLILEPSHSVLTTDFHICK